MKTLALMATLWTSGCTAPDATSGPAPPPRSCQPGEVAYAQGVAYTDLQSAADSLSHGGRITLCPGTHAVSGVVLDARPGRIELVGATGDPNDVILDGGRSGDMIVLYADGEYLLEAFTTTNTGLDYGYGHAITVSPIGDTSVTLRRIVSENHVGAQQSLDLDGSNVLVEDCEFRDYPTLSAGVIGATMDNWNPTSFIVRRTIFDNIDSQNSGQLTVNVGSNQGHADRVVLQDVQFINGSNFALSIGGEGADTTVLLDNVTISDVDRGPAPGFNWAAVVNAFGPDFRLGMRNVSIHDNTALSDSGLKLGTRTPPNRAEAVIVDSAFLRNISSRYAWSPALTIDDGWRVRFRDTDFGLGADDNSADIGGCSLDLGVVSGVVDPLRGDDCP